MWSEQTIQLIQLACQEDLGRLGDITSKLLDEPDAQVAARVVPREGGIICGLALVVMAGAGVQPSGTPLAPWMRIMCAGGGSLLAYRMALRAVACFRAARAGRRLG